MSFLAPLFLLGALAVALPVVFHLVRHTVRERAVFSSLMFLRPTPPRLTRRNRLEHLLLLALRCAVIGLLAIGFARPFIRYVLPVMPAPAMAQRLVVLVDSSASMRRANLWAEARARAEAVLRAASPADSVAVCLFDRQFKPLVSFEQWKSPPGGNPVALARQRFGEAEPGWADTHLDQALIRAAEMLAGAGEAPAGERRRIVLISDLQAGARLGALPGHDWPKGLELSVERLAPRRTGNAWLQLAVEPAESPRPAAVGTRVRVGNELDSKREQFQVGWARADNTWVGTAADIYVPAGQSRVVVLAAPSAGADRVILRGDEQEFDNTLFVLPPEVGRATVLYCGSDSETDRGQPLYFLRRAFQETPRQAVRVLAQPPTAPLAPAEAQAATLFVVTDALSSLKARALREQVSQGKSLLFVPGRGADALTLGNLLATEAPGLTEGSPASYALLGELDFRHPLFAPFADARFSDFTKIHFWKYRRLDTTALPGAQVLARFDNGDAALVEVPVGKGRVWFLASSWRPTDSQLALSSKFVPLLYSMLELSGGAPPPPPQYSVGDAAPLPPELTRANAPVAVVGPDGSTAALAVGATAFAGAPTPGVYRWSAGQATGRFAANLHHNESLTTPLPLDELERLGLPAARQPPPPTREIAHAARLRSAELENRAKLWRYFLVAALAALLAETWLAGWTARRQAAPGGVT
jgi:hypothetical protein